MPVPGNHVVARFIRDRKDEWSANLRVPKQKAFRNPPISLWSLNALNLQGDSLNDVRVAGFSGSGAAMYTVDQVYRIAETAANAIGEPFVIDIVWSPDGLEPHLQQWSYAHIEVVLLEWSESTFREFRRKLAACCERVIPPHP